MHVGLTCIERIVIESISRGNATPFNITQDTGLTNKIIMNLIQTLIVRGFILKTQNGLEMNNHLEISQAQALNSIESKRSEAIELIEGTILQGNTKAALNKVFLNERDYKIFQAMLRSLEQFVEGCQTNQKDVATKDMQIVFWGTGRYNDVIHNLIS